MLNTSDHLPAPPAARRPVILAASAIITLLRGETVCLKVRKADHFVPGMALWVKERWMHSYFPQGRFSEGAEIFYCADYVDDPWGADWERASDGNGQRQWLSASSMPRAASRLSVCIISVHETGNRQPSLWTDTRQINPYCEIGWCPKMYADKRRANKKQRRHGIFEVWKLKIPFAVPVAVGRI